jgi:hypothetical protein
MSYEDANYISELVPANPLPGDPISQGDDHIRMIKATLQNTFPGAEGPQYVPATPSSDGSTPMADDGRWVENTSVTTDSSGTLKATTVETTTVDTTTVNTQNFTTTDAQVDGTLLAPTISTTNLTASGTVGAKILQGSESLTTNTVYAGPVNCSTLSATGNITSTGTITGTHRGDGSQLTGLPSGYDDWLFNGTPVGSGQSVNISAGNNVTFSGSGRNITINSTATGGGTTTSVSAGNGISVSGGAANYTVAMKGSYQGNFTASGNVTAYSDDRLKVRDGEVVNALEKVKEIDTFYYTPSAAGEYMGMPDERNAGVSAQQVQEIFPEAVIESEGYLAVDYGRLVILCLEAIKQLSEDRD